MRLERTDDLERLRELWQEHVAAPFPASAHDVDDPPPELLDTEIAGLISSATASSGRLRHDQLDLLRRCLSDLDKLLPQLADDSRSDFLRLREMAALVLRLNE